MNYFRSLSPDELMVKIVKTLNEEVLSGEVYPLMATYSKHSCNRKCDEDGDYLCVNIKTGDEIYVVDIFPEGDTRVELSVFKRKIKESNTLYKMTEGESISNEVIINSLVNTLGFLQIEDPLSPKTGHFTRI